MIHKGQSSLAILVVLALLGGLVAPLAAPAPLPAAAQAPRDDDRYEKLRRRYDRLRRRYDDLKRKYDLRSADLADADAEIDALRDRVAQLEDQIRAMGGTPALTHTPTATATATPRPTRTPVPSLTSEELLYLLAVASQVERLGAARDDVVTVIALYGEAIFYNVNAQIALGAGMAVWLEVEREASRMRVPRRFRDWHNDSYLVWLGTFSAIVWAFADCVDNLNVISCQATRALIEEASAFEQQVVAELQVILDGIPDDQGDFVW
jgi:hypothetical protein